MNEIIFYETAKSAENAFKKVCMSGYKSTSIIIIVSTKSFLLDICDLVLKLSCFLEKKDQQLSILWQ